MPPRFDSEALTLELAVADLLDPQLARSIGFANRGGYERLWLGQAIHGRYQEEALAEDPTYRREVVVRCELEHRGWRVLLNGRLDGMRRESDGTRVVEEIKSVRREGQLAPALRELYERQAHLYAWMLARDGAGVVRAELVLIAIGSTDVERLELETDFEALERDVRLRLNRLLRELEAERRARADRRAAGQALAFPHAELRPGQEEIAGAVEEALASGSHLLVEAPTGIGKTAAALWPALKFALENDKRLFVLTAKNLQQEMAVRVLRQLGERGGFTRVEVARQGAHVRQRRGDLPRGLLRLRARLLRQAGDFGGRTPAARRGERARARSRLLGGGAGRGLPLRGQPRSRRARPGRGRRTTTMPSIPTSRSPTSAPRDTSATPSW